MTTRATPLEAPAPTLHLVDLLPVLPHLHLAVGLLRSRSRVCFEQGLWTDAQLTAESADALSAFVLRIDPRPTPESTDEEGGSP